MFGHLETNVVSDDVEQETTDKITACGVEDTGARKVEAETIMVVEFETIVHVVLEPPVEIPCLLYTSPSPRDLSTSRMPSSA